MPVGHDFRREETSQLFRSNMKGIRKVDNDLAVPLLELLRDILVRCSPNPRYCSASKAACYSQSASSAITKPTPAGYSLPSFYWRQTSRWQATSPM
jgi:hypothetical protein